MDIRIFIGAHRTAGLHIEQIIHKNQQLFKDQGIFVVKPAVHLPAFKAATDALEKGDKQAKVFNAYIKKVTKGADFKTLVILDRMRCGSVTRPTGKKLIYPQARHSMGRYAKIMPENSYKFFMGIRALSTFLPSCYSESLTKAKIETFEKFMEGTELRHLRWSEVLDRILRSFARGTDKDNGLVTWRFEDYPTMWRDVVGALTNLENPQDLVGDSLPVNRGLSLYGSQLMLKYLQEHTPKKPGDFKKVRDAFLDKFSDNDEMNPNPFGTPDFVEALDYAYDDDWYYIERMENVGTLNARPRF